VQEAAALAGVMRVEFTPTRWKRAYSRRLMPTKGQGFYWQSRITGSSWTWHEDSIRTDLQKINLQKPSLVSSANLTSGIRRCLRGQFLESSSHSVWLYSG
jgi:hypothetical protein